MVHSRHTNGHPQLAGVDNQERAIACCGAVMRDRYDDLLSQEETTLGPCRKLPVAPRVRFR